MKLYQICLKGKLPLLKEGLHHGSHYQKFAVRAVVFQIRIISSWNMQKRILFFCARDIRIGIYDRRFIRLDKPAPDLSQRFPQIFKKPLTCFSGQEKYSFL